MLPDWFELRSASIMVSACSLLMAAVLVAHAAVGRQVPGFAAWLVTATLTPVGLTLNNLQGSVPDWLAFPTGLAVMNAGVWCLWIGARQFAGRPAWLWTVPVVVGASALGGWYYSAVAPSVSARVLFVAPFHAWAAAGTAWLFWRRPDEDLRFALRFAAAPMAVFAVISAVRAVYAVLGPPMMAGFARTPTNTLAYLAGGTAMLCTNMGLVMCINAMATRDVRREADHDALTGLLNRHGLKRRFEAWRAAHPQGAAMLIDVDHFKHVNDRLGHAEGDRLLIDLAGSLARLAEPPVLACRLGGDEFAVLAPTAALGRELAGALAHHFDAHCRRSYGALDAPLPGLSLGLAAAGADLSATLKAADAMLYAAKSRGRRQLADGTTEMERDAPAGA